MEQVLSEVCFIIFSEATDVSCFHIKTMMLVMSFLEKAFLKTFEQMRREMCSSE